MKIIKLLSPNNFSKECIEAGGIAGHQLR